MSEIIKQDKQMLELASRVINQNARILEMNLILLKALVTPIFVVKGKRNIPRKEND